MPILKKKIGKAQTATCSAQPSPLSNSLKLDKAKKTAGELTTVSKCPFKAVVLNSFADDRSYSENFHNKSVKV